MNFHRIPLPPPTRTQALSPERVLRDVFGYESFRANQADIIEAAMTGQDVLALMPTGGGKSLCFQIPALASRKTALVISPLIALMRDQVDGLRTRGVRAAALPGPSQIDPAERLEIESAAASGSLDLIYASPEKLANRDFIAFLTACDIGSVAIDEAHSACEWGHDFRPDYLAIGERLEPLGDIPRMALTASAGMGARKEIARLLLRPSHRVFSSGFDRPNILLAAEKNREPKSRLLAILKSRRSKGAALVYVKSREGASDLAAWLKLQGIRAGAYHAGMAVAERAAVQDDFVAGVTDVMVATSAFGMGIDKRDIATVCHIGLPQGLEAYYQEIGRAGRDGRESLAWAAWTASEAGQRLRKAAGGDDPSAMRREIARVEGMLAYLENPSCRRVALLSKFGSAAEIPCGKCDVCLTGTELDSAASGDATAVLDEVSLRPADYTLMTLAETLLGFPAPDLPPATDAAGRFSGRDQAEVRAFLRQLLAAGLLDLDDRSATLKVTDAGARVLMLGDPVLLPTVVKPSGAVRVERKGRGLPTRLAEEWGRLVALRQAVSDRLGIRPDQVASDEDLTSYMATGRIPVASREEFRTELQKADPGERHVTPAVKGFDTGLF